MKPSPAASNGRSSRGTFGPGNQFGSGNPHRSQVQKLRGAMLAAITAEDVQMIVLAMIDKAIAGDIAAAKLILSTIGPPTEGDTTATAPVITQDNFKEIKNAWLARTN